MNLIWYVQSRFLALRIDWPAKPVFSVEVVTNGKDVKAQGEGGVLSFVAETSYKALNQNFDSLLLVCGLGTRNAEAHRTICAALRVRLRRLVSVRGSWLAERKKSDLPLEIQQRISPAISHG